MNEGDRGSQDPPADDGTFRGRRVARVFGSPDGMVVLVGKTARDNDTLSLELAAPGDFWLHVAGQSGSHVVVRNPGGIERLPRATLRFAAALAAYYSGARGGGAVAVHLARAADVGKPRGAKAGEVSLRRYRTIEGRPREIAALEGADSAG